MQRKNRYNTMMIIINNTKFIITPTYMSKYELSIEGIDKYFKNTSSKLFDNNIKQTPIVNFFREKNNIENKTLNDYHYILKTHESLSENVELEQKNVWLDRLNNVCSALKYCVNKLITNNNKDIELGIFGSDSVTSDIDIGVSYKKNTNINKKGLLKLSVVVKTFEDFFIKNGYTSLDIDVEMYADYFISPINGKPFIKMNKTMYDAILPYVVAGMIKNYVQAIFDKNTDFCDLRRVIKKIQSNTECFNTKKIENIINKFNMDNYVKFLSNFSEVSKKDKSNIQMLLYGTKEILPESKKIITDYITKDYESARNMYYTLLDEIHTNYVKYFATNDNSLLITLHKNITHALVYRAESYISAPTIYHVVYTIQAKQKKKYIYDLIGADGYNVSTLEQLGYLYRYYIQYCINNKCKPYFSKKKKKYIKRLHSALKENKQKTRKSKQRISKQRKQTVKLRQ